MRPSINRLRALALAATLAALLAACSQYLDRRDAVSLNAGNAVATDEVTQMVDPWPRDSANRNIAFNGERMQAAVARYRADRVIQPVGTGTSSTYGQTSSTYGQSSSAPPPAPTNNAAPLGPTVNSQTSVK